MNKPISNSASNAALSLLNSHLADADPDIQRAIDAELGRQQQLQ